ncbi:MAG: 4-alpha-glucanotransferase [Elusimicrobia bacterium]|nr:4-alpha-glucanotransferase [Elusimicrobiota bacterium]
MRRYLSAALSAALVLSSWGPSVSSVFAQQVSGKAASVSVIPQFGLLPVTPGAGLGSPSVLPLMPSPSLSLSPSLAAPSLNAARPIAAPAAAVPAAALVSVKPLIAPAKPVLPAAVVPSALEAVKPSAPGESFGAAAAQDFAERMTGERLVDGNGMVEDAGASVDASVPLAFRRSQLNASRENGAPVIPEPAPPIKPEGEKRGLGFPLALAGLSGLAWGVTEFARWGSHAFTAASAEPTVAGTFLAVAAIGAMALTGVFVLSALVDAVSFVGAVWRGRKATDADLRAFLRAEVLEGRLDGNAAALIKPYRPDNRWKDFTFAFASRGLIWVRPELAATPWLLRQILLHELTHMKASAPRGPPRGALRGLLSAVVSEVRARAVEFKGPGALKQIKVSGLQRALTQTQTSLRLSRPYEVLVLNPDSRELEDPKLYAGLSDGAARVTALNDDQPQKALAESSNRYRAIVLGRATQALPEPKSKDALRLQEVLKQLDSLYVLATRLVVRGDSFSGTSEASAWTDLVERAQRLRENGSSRAMKAFEGEVRKLWRQIASQRLKGVGVSGLMDGLYSGLRDRGFAFLSFGPDDAGVVSWEKLLRYWESADGGQFKVTRVDLEDGGHLLILRKVEARVGLWLRPVQGGRIATSVPNASFTEEGRATARKSLEDAGFGPQLELFDKMEVAVRHVFGADVGRQEIYVTVPRRNASAIRKFVSANAEILGSQSDFQPHLMDSAELQGVKPVWKLGITGAAGSILWIDTGADSTHTDFGGRLDVVDMVDEGTEDWIGHGTHVAGTSISGNEGFLGMARGAKGTMAKVFSRDQPGASDGEIMGSAAIAQKKGVDVISLSLGSRGSSADNLADFFSQLTKQKNVAGEYPIVTASAGNSGPFDRTLSQPAAGVEVIAVAAAAKSKDDGIREISFYSSVGPDIDRRYAIKRFRFKPDITAIGGDVTTSPGSSNVYKEGVYSAKSKDSPRSASDLEDGKHTGMSGTSMSNPSLAGIALLVKLAMRSAGAITPFVAENMAFAVKAVLMRTARDMGVPVWFQGAGFVDAWEAVSLVAASGTRALGTGARNLWRRLTGAVEAPAPNAWAWLERLKAVQDAEDRAFREAELAKSEAQTLQEGENTDEPSEEPVDRSAAGNAVQAEVAKRFAVARDAEVPAVLAALKDEVWLVRLRAAAALMNLKSPASAAALAEAGLNDPDARVRQMAFLALAEIPTHSVDALLSQAASNGSWDIGVYAAYALARRGDRSAIARAVRELGNADKRARFSSVWLLGQIGSYATAAEAEGLSARVRDRGERGNIRHLASAALSNLADAAPEAISDRVVTDLLDAAGVENLALTRTIAKVFPVAVRSKAFVARLRSEPLKPIVTDFVVRNRDAINKPGALSELVQLLARAAGVPLDAPTSPMDGSGSGVTGVDEAMGPVDLIALPPSGEGAVDVATLTRFETTTKATLPRSGALWLSVPEHKLYALTIALEHRGWTVRRSLPFYPLSNSPAEPGGLTLDLGDGEKEASLPADADLSLVRVRAAGGVSEVRVMAALELVAEAARKGGRPVMIALTLAAPTTRRTPLSVLIDRLVASGIGVVVGAGNAGPTKGTVAAPGDSGLAVVVAAASADGLQFYSSRGTPEAPRVTWTDLVDDLRPGEALAAAAVAAADAVLGTPAPAPAKTVGTAAAAERTAAKLAGLARVLAEGMTASGRALPDGWFLYLTALVKRTVTPLPSYGEHEVGAGLFDSEDRALDALRARLHDPEAIVREAKALADQARSRTAFAPAAGSLTAGLASRAARAVLSGLLAFAPVPPSLKGETPPAADASRWWKDASATRTSETVPLYALRSQKKTDPGVGKYSDLGRYYRDELKGQGVDAVLLLPHFATLDESPYAPVSLYALNEDQIDWSQVDEVRADPALAERVVAPSQSVDYPALRARESAVAREAYSRFVKAGGADRARDFAEFAAKNAGWLDEYAEFMTLSALIGKPVLDWTAADERAARAAVEFPVLVAVRRWSQWLARAQLKAAVGEVHAAGGKVLFDIPMFRAKNSVDAWKRPGLFADLRTRNPGIINAWIHEDWKDLALWRWSELRKDGYAAALDPYRHWLDFGFDGARADALHFAYKFGNGQLASGDEPGDEFVAAVSRVLSDRGAFPLAEAFEGKDADARRLGFLTVGGDWKKVSSHDDPRSPDFLVRYFAARREGSSGANAKFVAYTLGDEWRDPFAVKEMRRGVSTWRYRIPLPEDADYSNRVRADSRPQLRMLTASRDGDVWKAPGAARAAFTAAADAFVKRDGDSVQIWAASMDWFLEEWGRDTFISLPGLLLTTGRFADARSVLRRFAAFEKGGLIPNKTDGKNAEYNTADAPMWYVQAIKSYAEASGDWAFVDEMAPVVRRIMAGYEKGASYERYGRKNRIYMDSDGLVVTPAQATWMDADPEGRDKPVTPRNGKTVEINALWYANLRFLAALEARAGDTKAAAARNALADKVKASFNEKFWFETEDNRRAWGGTGGALRDVVEGDPHGEAIRPNMLFAVSRGGDLLSPERRRAVVLAATRDLLTRKGPRTLSDRDSGYRARYDTSKPPLEKDLAYHQGTVWPWLMGAFAEALAQVRRDMGWDEARTGDETRALITPLVEALAGVPEGSLPEVYDGGDNDPALKDFSLDDPAGLAPVFRRAGPEQKPGGTRSQAWSVAEILRLLAR